MLWCDFHNVMLGIKLSSVCHCVWNVVVMKNLSVLKNKLLCKVLSKLNTHACTIVLCSPYLCWWLYCIKLTVDGTLNKNDKLSSEYTVTLVSWLQMVNSSHKMCYIVGKTQAHWSKTILPVGFVLQSSLEQ